MNRIFRTVWNAVRGKLVAVEESKTGHSQAGGCRRRGALVAAAAAAAAFAPGFAGAFDLDMSDPKTSFTLFNNDRVTNGHAEMIDKKQILLSKGNSLTVSEGGYFMTNLEGNIFYSDVGSKINVARYDADILKDNPYVLDVKYTNFELWSWETEGATATIGSAYIAEDFVQHSGDTDFTGLLTAKDFDVRGGTVDFNGETFDISGTAVFSGGTTTLAAGNLSFTGADPVALNDSAKFVVAGGKLVATGGIDVHGADSLLRIQAVAAMDDTTPVKVTGGTLEAASRGLSFGGEFTAGTIRTADNGTLTFTKEYALAEGMNVVNPNTMTFNEALTVAGGSVRNDGQMTFAKTLAVTDGTFANAGHVNAQSVTMTGGEMAFTVDEAGTTNITVAETFYAAGGVLSGQGDVHAKNVTLTDSLALNASDLNFEADETLVSNGNFTAGNVAAQTVTVEAGALAAKAVETTNASVADGSTLDADSLAFSGTVTNAGTITADVLAETSAGRIDSTGKLTVGTAGKTEGATIALLGTNAKLDVTNDGFFTNTNFEVKDGAQMDLADYGVSTLGEGNAYVVEHASWQGSVTPDEQSHVDASAFDGMSKLSVANLTSEGEVTIKTGGLVETSTVNLTQADTVHLEGGALMTKLGGMFEGVTSETILIDAESPSDTVVVDSKLLGVSDIGDIKGGIAEGIDWQSGTIAFSDDFVSLSAIASSQAAIGTAAGDAASSVQVVFTGDVLEAASGGGLTVDTLEDLKAEQEVVSGSAVINPGIVLAGSTLTNTKGGTPTQKLVFGTTAEEGVNAIDLSIGFSKIAQAEEVQVTNGRELVLVGIDRADGNTWSSDAAQLLPDAAQDGKATVDAGGRLTFGTYGLGYQTAGWIQEVTNAGTLTVKSGEFGIKGTYDTTGTTDVQKGSTLHVRDLMARQGSVTTATDAGLALESFRIDEGAKVATVGTSTLTSTSDGTVAGTLSTSAQTTATLKNLTVNTGGTAELMGGATGDTLTLEEAAKTTLSGEQTWNKIASAGFNDETNAVITVDEAGKLKLAAAEKNDLTGGKLVNAGSLDFSGIQELSLSATLENTAAKDDEGRGAKYDDLVVGTLGVDKNTGYEEGDLLKIRGSWQNSGVAVWNGFEADDPAGGAAVDADNLKGATLTVGANGMQLVKGTMTNAGKIDSTAGLVTVSGAASSNAADAEWAYDDLTITAGSSVNDGYEHGDVLTVSGEGSWTNNGRAEWTGVAVSGGTASVGADGTLKVGSAEQPGSFEMTGGQVSNLGQTDTTNVATAMLSGGTLTNGDEATKDTASWHYANLTITGGSSTNNATEEGKILNVSDDGSWTNNHVANWEQANFNNDNAVNNGTLTGTVTVGGSLTGTGSIQGDAEDAVSMNGTLEQNSVTTGTLVSSGGHSKVDVGTLVAYKEIWNQTGNVIEADSVSTKDVKNAGSITVTGSLEATGTVTNEADGTISAGSASAETFTNAGTATIAGELDAVTTTNSGALSLGTVTNFGSDKTYVHDGADATLTIADGSHFTGTNLIFTGGGNVYVSETDGNPSNFSGLDNSLGENVVTISGDAPYEMEDGSPVYPEGTTTVYVDRLGSESDVTLEEGGRLVVDNIDFDGTEDTLKLAGGALSTTLGEMFEGIKNEYILIDADSPDDTADVSSTILGVESIGELKDTILAGIDWVKGAFGITDEAVSAGAVASVSQAVAEAAGENAANIDVVFEGDLFGDTGIVGDLTITDVSDLFEEQQGIEGSAVTNPGVILASTSLDAKDDEDGIVTIGGDAADINGNIGFESIKNADGVKVEEGRGTLIGNKLDPNKTGDNFDWSDDNRLIESETAGSGGTVVIGENGRFDFGSKGTEDKHTGWVDSVVNDGTFVTTNGEHGVKGDLTTTANGKTLVDDDSVLHVGGIDTSGSLTNEGVIILDGPDGSQTVVVEDGGSFTQDGTLDTNGKDAQIAGYFTTSNGAGTEDEGTLWNDVSVTGDGSLHVAEGGRDDGNTLDLSQGGDNAWTVDKGGESHWNDVVDASGSNAGSVSVGDDQGREDGVKAEDSHFNVATGDEYVNTGDLDLTGSGNSEIDGTITTGNGGTTNFDDATVGPDGKDHVGSGGKETGDVFDLSQGGKDAWEVDEGGESVWGEVIDATGSNDGSVTVGRGDHEDSDGDGIADTGDFNVADGDEYVNTGDLDLTDAGNTEVDGDLITGNGGDSKFDDVTVGSDGSLVVDNGGSVSGDVLDLTDAANPDKDPWQVAEGGHADFNEVHGADGVNDGSVDIGKGGHEDADGDGKADTGDFTVDEGDHWTNTGDADLTDSGNTVVDGSITTGNGGKTDYDDVTVNEGGTIVVENGGEETGDKLDLTPGGDYVVEEGGKADWGEIHVGKDEDHPEGGGSFTNDGETTVDKVVIGEGGSFDNNGDLDGGELVVEGGGLVNVDGGDSGFDKTTIHGDAWVAVGNGETPDPAEKAVFQISTTDTVEGDVFVVNNGELVFTSENTDETFDDLIKAPQLPDAPVKVVVGGTVHVGSKGSLSFGNGTYVKPAEDAEPGDRGTANVETGTGNLFFGSDSTTVVSVPGIGKGPAFTTDSNTATVTVEDGATLILGNVSEAGQYLITDGFLTENGTLVEGWLDEEHLFALNEDGTGLDWVLDLGYDTDSIWVDVAYADVRTEYPDLVMPDNTNDSLKHGSDPRGPQDIFINEILKDKTIGVDEKTRIINSVVQIGTAGGSFGAGFDNMTAAVDALEGRISFAGETFTHDGRMVAGETGTDLWAVALGGSHSVDSNTASGGMKGGYEADTYGFMAGMDHKIRGTNWRTGVALSYQEGDLDSTGDWLDASTDYDTFGIQAYANYSPNPHFNLIGSVGYFRNGAETTMGLPAASKTFREASADVDIDMFAAAARMEGRFDVGSVSVIPHAGVRMLITNAGSYSTKFDGQTAFESDADSLMTGQLPIGVAVRGDFTGANGWTWRPTADVTVMPQFGDVDVRTLVTGADTGITERVESEMTGHFVATGSLGIQAEKDDLTIGAGYGFTGGMSGQADHAFNVNVRWRF